MQSVQSPSKRLPGSPTLPHLASLDAEQSSPFEELKQLKAVVTDLQTKRLSALRLYQDEKLRRQNFENQVDTLSAKLSKLQHDSSCPPQPTQDTKMQSRSKPSSSPADAHAHMGCQVERDTQIPVVYNEQPHHVNFSHDAVVAPNSPDAREESSHQSSPYCQTIPSDLGNSNAKRPRDSCFSTRTKLGNVLPSPPKVVALLNPIAVAPPAPSIAPSLTPDLPSHIVHSTESPSELNVSQQQNPSSGIPMLTSEDGAPPSDDDTVQESDVTPIAGDRFDDEQGDSDSTDVVATSPPQSAGDNVGDSILKASACGSSTDELNSLREEVTRLRARLLSAEGEVVDVHRELSRSEHLMAEMQEQLKASTAACREMIETINEQEDTIDHLSQK